MNFQEPEELQLDYRNAYIEALDSETPEVFNCLKGIATKYSAILNIKKGNGMRLRFWGDRFVDWRDYQEEFGKGFIYGWITDNWRFYGADSLPLDQNVEDFLTSFDQFKTEYADFLNKYFLTEEWLENHVRFILEMLTNEGDAVVGISASNVIEARDVIIGSPLRFEYAGFRLGRGDVQTYKKGVIQAFKKHLDQHLRDTRLGFKSQFKQGTKSHKFADVKWLVYWTVKQKSKAEILEMIDLERSAKRGEYVFTDESTLNKLFQKLKEFDLPVREEKSKPQNGG